MTKRERVLAALAGRRPDHVPCGFSLHFPPEEKAGEAAVAAHLKFFQETDTDIYKVMNENLVPDCGPIQGPEDWKCLQALGPGSPFIQDQIALAKAIRDRWDGEEGYWLGTLHGITASGIHPYEHRMGYDAARDLLVTCLRQDEAKVLDGLKRIAECMCALAWGYKEAGMDGIYYASLGGERDRWFTAEEFARWIVPLDQLILSEIQKAGCAAVLHICKDHLDMERYRSYNDFCDAVNWGVYEAPYSIEEGRALFPGKPVMGGLANHAAPLAEGPVEALAAEAKRLAQTYGPENFILGADCTLSTEIDRSRVRVVAQALREI